MSCFPIMTALESAASRFPDNLALQMYDDNGVLQYRYGHMMDLVRRLSGSLRRMGIRAGDPVILWARLSPKWVLAYLGTLHNGSTVVPLDFEYAPGELAAILSETEARILFTVREKAPQLQEMRSRFSTFPLLVALDLERDEPGFISVETLFQNPPAASPEDVSMDDAAAIFYTSGTTGQPKGAVISHRSMTNSAHGLLQYIKGSHEDRTLALIPSHHIFASIANVLVPLMKGASVTCLRTLNSTALLETLVRAKITILPAVPQLFYLLHKRILDEIARKPWLLRLIFKLMLRACIAVRHATGLNPGRILFSKVHRAFGGHLRLLVSAASYFDPIVISDLFGLGFDVQQGYALTETFAGGTFTPHFSNRLGSAGKPIPGVQVKLVDVDESGVGEIAISGPSVMKGYFKNEEATSEVLRQGWFYTGDLARVDEDGNYYITGRKKELIVFSSGKKCYPEEIERHYSKVPAIAELCVLGISDSSGYASAERLHAIIVPDFDYLRSKQVVNSKDAIREGIEQFSASLPKHKRILSYEIRTEPLPRTTTRKIMRHIVAQQISKGGDGEKPRSISPYTFVEGDDRLEAWEVSSQVLELVRRESRFDGSLHLGMNLELDLGFDSLQRIELVAQIEQKLSIDLGDDAASRFLTVRDLLRLVEEKQSIGGAVDPGSRDDARVTWSEILAAADSDEMAEKYVLRASRVHTFAHYLFFRVVYILARLLFRLKVDGLENLPDQYPFLICPNHQSYLDGILVPSVLPYRVLKRLFSLGFTPFFSGGIKEVLARLGRIVPIDPDTNVARATRISAIGLKAKQNLLVFPEGSLSCDGQLQPFKKGAAILARELGVPVVPVGISGSFNAWSKVATRIRLAPISIRFGRPVALDGCAAWDTDREREYEQVTQQIKSAVERLTRQRT